jgi:hypothetical protein
VVALVAMAKERQLCWGSFAQRIPRSQCANALAAGDACSTTPMKIAVLSAHVSHVAAGARLLGRDPAQARPTNLKSMHVTLLLLARTLCVGMGCDGCHC